MHSAFLVFVMNTGVGRMEEAILYELAQETMEQLVGTVSKLSWWLTWTDSIDSEVEEQHNVLPGPSINNWTQLLHL